MHKLEGTEGVTSLDRHAMVQVIDAIETQKNQDIKILKEFNGC